MPDPRPTHIAYFISPHGFGHAARAGAVMMAVQARDPAVHFEIFTTVPEWFFRESLAGPYTYHSTVTDVGLVQQDTFIEDLPATVARLDALLPFREDFVASLAGAVREAGCALVLCDIAPLGIAVAQAANVPSVLVENFTWDWIYAGYLEHEPRFARHIAYLADLFGSADYHIQTEPVCRPGRAEFTTPPVSRPAHTPRSQMRDRLGIPDAVQTVLVSMGGIPGDYPFIPQLKSYPDICFIIPGVSDTWVRDENVLLLPHDSGLYHPDMITATDVVIAKLGYSTVAEAYQAGSPLGYVGRSRFAESEIIKQFVMREMQGIEIQEAEFTSGAWLELLPRLLKLPRMARTEPNGAEEIADFIKGLVGG